MALQRRTWDSLGGEEPPGEGCHGKVMLLHRGHPALEASEVAHRVPEPEDGLRWTRPGLARVCS